MKVEIHFFQILGIDKAVNESIRRLLNVKLYLQLFIVKLIENVCFQIDNEKNLKIKKV